MSGVTWSIAPTPVEDPESAATVRAYIDDIASRFYGRQATDEEIDASLVDEPERQLMPPHGAFLLARAEGDDRVAGCVGVRLMEGGATAELKRVWVAPHARRRGLGSLLVEAAEREAAALGATAIRLDTRDDLVEARRLYERRGYVAIAPYNDSLYAEHWLEKKLP
ncbi:GNAT family N-acetyltransferase [Streptomyces iconiensis]|uniref:GNAT family N-acetyltransferase n=1 Tax=Streptomyces iconiensis TaxID=1384038 RepID=A0ABT7A8J3_9ACTN|nr:GNAT family N-acetyltransferase [Streptomyces iconiensis]MDJ1137672.1 GNAT family N-acetyltransferase [Streptomyces iconiensis]